MERIMGMPISNHHDQEPAMPRFLPATAAFVLLISPVWAQQPAPSSPPMPGMSGGQSPANNAMMEGMNKMNQAMSSAPMTGDPDRDFVARMIPHHQGAIDMARVELQYGKDPEMRKLARGIVAAQENEIAEMKRWQARHSGR
jgi:hypothetical protein